MLICDLTGTIMTDFKLCNTYEQATHYQFSEIHPRLSFDTEDPYFEGTVKQNYPPELQLNNTNTINTKVYC